MKSRERIQAVLNRQTPDRVPRFEIWIDALLDELGLPDVPTAHVRLGQDSMMMPTQTPESSNAWKNGVDEWGRLWKDGMYVSGVLDRVEDLQKYSPPMSYAAAFFDEENIKAARQAYPDHMLMYGSHLGPFMGAYMAMGFERFFVRLFDNPRQVHEILENRTEWAIAMYKHAIQLGAEILVMGEDAAHKQAPMISPKMWSDFVYPYHRRIVESIDRPMIFHSDGNILTMLPQVIEAGFVGYHSLEPAAGIDLTGVKNEYGKDLILIGNVDVRILAGDSLQAVRQEVDRCIAAGSPGGGYMISTCNSIFKGLNPEAVAEMFQYEQVLEK